MAEATISACFPTLRPLFTKRIPDARTDDHINKDFTVTVTSGRIPQGSVLLTDQSATYKVWAGTRMPGHNDEIDERPFVKLEDSEGVSVQSH